MPPLQALVALHGLWVFAFVAVGVWGAKKWPTAALQIAAYALSVMGLGLLGFFVSRELWAWYPAGASEQRRYLGQRILYVIGTNTDLPVVQVLLTGIGLWFAARRRRSLARAEGLTCRITP